MLHRIFLAINLPDSIKQQLLFHQKKRSELPIRWTSVGNIHITLVFLGNTSETELQKLSRLIERIGKNRRPFSVELSRIVYGPTKSNPKMIWVTIKKSDELLGLQKDLETALNSSENIHYTPEKRPYSSHLTLGRLRMMEFRKMEIDERPEVSEDISLSFTATSLEIMESKLRSGGAEYTILQSTKLTA
ncbi:RNA 2',3'-cyclic phosphodiesterase [Patescibacteria group bacterium]|nr:RNA 2',3'-cyclic phosphodiesterase [Patescibacteria group bacterium]